VNHYHSGFGPLGTRLAQNTMQPNSIFGLQLYEFGSDFSFCLGAGQAQNKDNCRKTKQEWYFGWSHYILTFR
jgi:hypothetical protein